MIWATRNIERNVIPLLYNLSEAVKLPLPPNFQKMPFSLPGGVFRLSDGFFLSICFIIRTKHMLLLL